MAKAPPPPPEFGKIEPTKEPPGGKFPSAPPDQEAFEKYMKEPLETEKTEGTARMSPMELPSKTSQIPPTPENLLNQIDTTTNQITDIQKNLQTPSLELKKSHERLLDTKLTESHAHLQKAAEYLGANKLELSPISPDARPIAKFLGYLADGQNQLTEAKRKLQEIQTKGKQLTPSEMLLVQVNLAQAQQQIEFSSVLLSKVVDALKQTINIQL